MNTKSDAECNSHTWRSYLHKPVPWRYVFMQENLTYLVLSDYNQVYLYIPLLVLGVVVTIFHVPVDVVLQCHVFVKILLYSYHKPLAHNNKPLVGLKLTSLLLRPMILNFSFSANFPPYHKRRWQIFDTLTLFVHSTPKYQPDTIQWKDHLHM